MVFDLGFLLLPQCISSPNSEKVALMSFVPVAASCRVLNGKLLSSRKVTWMSCVVVPDVCAGQMWLVSWALAGVDNGVYSASIRGSLACAHFFSSLLEKAVMTNRKITGDWLSPCLTPTVCDMLVDSLPSFRVTRRSE